MRFLLRQKNFEITPALRTYIDNKILKPAQKLVKNIKLPDLPILDLNVMRTTLHHRKGQVYRVSANLALNGKLIRVEREDEDVRAAIDSVEDELRRGILSYRQKITALLKRGARRAKKELRLDQAARFFRRGRIREEGI